MENHLDLVENTVRKVNWFMKDLYLKERKYVLVRNGMMMLITIVWCMKVDIAMMNDGVKVFRMIWMVMLIMKVNG